MMDRNLGATSATPGDAGALGLLYQWGRKDPFPGASSISGHIEAKSTFNQWPRSTMFFEGMSIDYTIQNPTKLIQGWDGRDDWLLTEDGSVDNTRWQAEKTIYDPCPAGYRVPDGGENGVWAKAPRLTLRRYMTVQTRVSTSGRRVNPNTSSPRTPTAGIRLPESTIWGIIPTSMTSVNILPVGPVPHKTKGSAFS